MTIPVDRGAKFRKCDFQVHTPRDAQWSGADAVSDAERMLYAEELIKACRTKSIGSIAITDHHDFAFFPFVRKAALSEVDAAGIPIAEDARIVVFPGIEVTLTAPACQALLILDVDFPETSLPTVLAALAITAIPAADSKVMSVIRIPQTVVADLADMYEKLNNHDCLRGRYIVFPNVSEKGYGTLLRSGFGNFYKSMPCVGGYTDGEAKFGAGNLGIVNGENEAYGFKPIAVFQTSDNRTRDHADLGKYTTWVKWTEPSAEALRQACLARRSRISQMEPVYPLAQIVGVTVSNSKFLGTIALGLNPQFNACIGGRGTGKSSLMEYIRWALCDDPLDVKDDGVELPNFQKRRQALVEQTLKPVDGKVTVFYKRNEVVYQIERVPSDKSGTVSVFDSTGKEQRMTPDQVRQEFPVVSYAQKQLSCVGTLPEEVNRLITDPIKEKLAEVQDRIDRTIIPQLKEQRTRERRLSVLNTQIAETATAIKSKKEQVQALQLQLLSLTPEQQSVVQKHDVLNQQDQSLVRTIELPERMAQLLEQARDQINALLRVVPQAEFPDVEKLRTIAADVDKFQKAITDVLTELVNQARTGRWVTGENQRCIEELRAAFSAHQVEYNKCVTESAKNKKQLDEIQNLNKQIAELETRNASSESERNTQKVVFDNVGSTKWTAFLESLTERAELLKAQCKKVNELAQHEFQATVAFCADTMPLKKALTTMLLGRNIKNGDQKIDALSALVRDDAHPIKRWAQVMAEFDLLCANKDASALPDTPILGAADFSSDNFRSIRSGIVQETLDAIRYLNVNDQIVFWYKLGKKSDGADNYIPFNSASQGQQATCLLRTLLSQSGAPLLIDQPEEDLDNEQIHVLSQRIAETKQNRQLLFVSHNANIVVNGDAELVVCFNYRESGDNTRGKIDAVGSIDCRPVRGIITTVMEGGRAAFELRKSKYGF